MIDKFARCAIRGMSTFRPISTPMLPPGTFDNQTVFITGGGTGLGKAMTETFAKLGANVMITSRKQDVLDATAKELRQSTGKEIFPLAADVRDPDSIAKAAETCVAKLGIPTVIVNNAAGNFISPTERLSPKGFRTVVEIVLLGTANVTLEWGKRLIENQKQAAFLSISAPFAQTGSGFVVPSACSKSGVEALTKSLSSEWMRYGLRFNSLSLGSFYTKGAWSRLDPDGTFSRLATKPPNYRIGEVTEISNFATYLCSDYASWLSGQVIVMDGGHTAFTTSDFNKLVDVPKEKWDLLEKAIRSVKGS